jgi:DNA-binding CsgD family transcriptional regulator
LAEDFAAPVAVTTLEARGLLERATELGAVEAALDAAHSGTGGLIVVEGSAGIGKTRLLQAARELAHSRSFDVLRSTGSELERALPFGVCLQLYEARVAGLSGAQRDELLGGAASLAEGIWADTGEPSGPPRARLLSVVHGLYWLTSNLAEKAPLLVLVDDAHWADRESLEFLVYLGRRLEDLGVVVAVSFRSGEPDTSDGLLARLSTLRAARVLRLAPLSLDSVRELVRVRLPRVVDESCRACAQITAGNPFLLHELLGALEADRLDSEELTPARVRSFAPATIRQSVMLRLARLPTGSASLARAVAVLGPDANLDRAAALAELDSESAARAADALTAVEVLDAGHPPRLEFAHPLLASAVYADIPFAERADEHLRAARALAAEGLDAERLAVHLRIARTSHDPWVSETLLAAARRAVARGSPTSAVQYLRRALAESPQADLRRELLRELARAEAVSGDPASASERLGEALNFTEDPRARAHLLLELGHIDFVRGDLRQAIAAFERGIEQVGDRDEELAVELKAGRLMVAQLEQSMRSQLVGQRDEILERAVSGSTHGERVLLAQMAMQLVFAGEQRDRPIALAKRALAGGQLLERETSDGMSWLAAAGALGYSDEFASSREPLEAALNEAQRRGSITGFAQASYGRSFVLHHSGDLAGAIADLESALEGVRHGWRQFLPAVHAQLSWALIERGELERAAATLAEVDDREWGETVMTALVLESRARLQLVVGRPDEALSDALAAGRIATSALISNPSVLPWRSRAALAAARLGDVSQARALVEEELRLARRFGASRTIGAALHAAGLIEPGPRAIELLQEAVVVLDDSPARLELTRALVDLGAALRRQRHRADAREPLRRGLDMAHRSGATVLTERAHTELLATGARPRRLVLTGVDSLTPSERRIAELAAQGLGNRQIAQALFISLRTVEAHLGHIYRKLDVTSRRELKNVLTTTRTS